MLSSQLQNYLLSNRKRLDLSQDDMAFLLGVKSGTAIGRFEKFSRIPSLEAALACEVIFKRSVSELFGGLYQQVEMEVARRAGILVEKEGIKRSRKQAVLAQLAAR